MYKPYGISYKALYIKKMNLLKCKQIIIFEFYYHELRQMNLLQIAFSYHASVLKQTFKIYIIDNRHLNNHKTGETILIFFMWLPHLQRILINFTNLH